MLAGSLMSRSVHESGTVRKPLTGTVSVPFWHRGRKLTAQSTLPSKTAATSVMSVGEAVGEVPTSFLTNCP